MRVFDDETRRRLDVLKASAARAFAGDAGAGAALRGAEGRHEFRDHRPYGPGDDLRSLDWNLFGRLDELHVKRYREESGLDVRIVLDRSASMAVLDRVKEVFALRVAAGLACVLAGEGREIHVCGLGEEMTDAAPVLRRVDGVPALLDRLEALPPCAGRAETALVPSLYRDPRRKRLVILLSDFLGEDFARAALGESRGRQVAVALGVVIARGERHPPAGGVVRLVGVEGEGRATVDVTPSVRDRFARLFDLHLQEIARVASARGATSAELACEEPFESAVFRLLRGSGAAR